VIRVRWPAALATLFVVLLGWYLVYTQTVVRALEADAQSLAQVYQLVQTANAIPDTTAEGTGETIGLEEGAMAAALFELQRVVVRTGVPLVVTIPKQGEPGGDSVYAVENLPFEVALDTPEGQARVLEYAAWLDTQHDPVGDPTVQHLHYGNPPEVRRLRWIRWLQVAGLLLTVAVGFALIRSQHRAESERTWTSMARELAHQLGTPISSLQGWLEVIRLSPDERPGSIGEGEIAHSIEEDLERLERISHRFELIGREPELERVAVPDVVRDLKRYLSTRLPRFGPGVRLDLSLPTDLPEIKGNEVLLAWALENIVKNSLDALAGRGGVIRIEGDARGDGQVVLRISDDGPGVAPEVRESLFDPGVTTKSGGWGVGLALSRRIVEGVHGGRIELLDRPGPGATFQIRLPAADTRRSR